MNCFYSLIYFSWKNIKMNQNHVRKTYSLWLIIIKNNFKRFFGSIFACAYLTHSQVGWGTLPGHMKDQTCPSNLPGLIASLQKFCAVDMPWQNIIGNIPETFAMKSFRFHDKLEVGTGRWSRHDHHSATNEIYLIVLYSTIKF